MGHETYDISNDNAKKKTIITCKRRLRLYFRKYHHEENYSKIVAYHFRQAYYTSNNSLSLYRKSQSEIIGNPCKIIISLLQHMHADTLKLIFFFLKRKCLCSQLKTIQSIEKMYKILSRVVVEIFNNSKSTFYGLNSKLLLHIHEKRDHPIYARFLSNMMMIFIYKKEC